MKTRGSFATAALAAVLCGTLIWTACSTAWIGQAEEIVAALIPAVANLITLITALQGNGVSAQDLNTLITQYQQATDAATQTSLLAKIQTAIASVRSNLSGLLAALHISDAATQSKVTAVIGLILAEVQSLEAIIPLVHSGSVAQASAALKAGKVKPPLTAGEFRASYNTIMTAKTGSATLDSATAKCKLHGPGFWHSLGTALGEAKFGQ
jgi:hypothetical protein